MKDRRGDLSQFPRTHQERAPVYQDNSTFRGEIEDLSAKFRSEQGSQYLEKGCCQVFHRIDREVQSRRQFLSLTPNLAPYFLYQMVKFLSHPFTEKIGI
jgi:hypothetical protein